MDRTWPGTVAIQKVVTNFVRATRPVRVANRLTDSRVNVDDYRADGLTPTDVLLVEEAGSRTRRCTSTCSRTWPRETAGSDERAGSLAGIARPSGSTHHRSPMRKPSYASFCASSPPTARGGWRRAAKEARGQGRQVNDKRVRSFCAKKACVSPRTVQERLSGVGVSSTA